MIKRLLLLFWCTGALFAGSVRIEPGLMTRTDTLKGTIRTDSPLAGPGSLKIRWTDSYGRLVAEEIRPVELRGDSLPFTLPLGRAVALQNFLDVELTAGASVLRFDRTEFVVTPDEGWNDYQVILYYPYRPQQQPALRDLGVTAGQIQNVSSRRPDGASAWWKNDFRFYCDQMAYDFYAPYHTPALKDKEQRMREAKALYRQDRSSKQAFFRQPCFHDTEAESTAMARIREVVSAQMRFRPFFYSTDETGVANLVEAWDFCFCPLTLTAMRQWLLGEYGSLEGINREWGTRFRTLEEVTPLSTDEMMKRGDDNLSPWADHRTFMNLTFASAAGKAGDAARAVDPKAIAGLVGCQMPAAFGGYDYWLLSQAIDVAEPYNIGNNREIWRSFAPRKPALTTGFGADPTEIWRLWYQALHGDRGVIIYDEQNRYLQPDGQLTPLGNLVAPTYRELTGGIGRQLIQMERIDDPIAVHYSQPSINAHWMFEHRPLGESWIDKRSSYERTNSDFLRLRQSVLHLLEDNLQQYYFVSYRQLEEPAGGTRDARVFFLPQSIALSRAEADTLRRFVERGGTLVADCRTALMDQHARMLPQGQLDDLFGIERLDARFHPGPTGLQPVPGKAASSWPALLEKVAAAEPGIRVRPGATALYQDAGGVPAVILREHGRGGRTLYLNAVITDYHRWRQRPPEGDSLRQLVSEILRQAGVRRQFRIAGEDGKPVSGVEVHPWKSGNISLLGIHRNYGLRINELGPPEYQKQEALEAPLNLTLLFDRPVALYDARAGKFLGNTRQYRFSLDQIQPTLLAVLPAAAKELSLHGPGRARAGELLKVNLALTGARWTGASTFCVRVTGPDDKELRMLRRNLSAPEGKTVWEIPLAADAVKGSYRLQVRDVLTGIEAAAPLVVE